MSFLGNIGSGDLGPRHDRAAPGGRRFSEAQVVVVGNEKGGAGKSTVAALIAIAMLYRGRRVSVIDLDLRQQSLSRLLANRRRWLPAAGVSAPMPVEYKLDHDTAALADDQPMALSLFREALTRAVAVSDLVVVDTPGSDTLVARTAYLKANTVFTPMNDSFVDFDVLGVVDPVTLGLIRPSHYAREVLNARMERARTGQTLDWILCRNRVSGADNQNRRRLDVALETLAKEVGFRVAPHLRERVAYREMFPYGLTLADLAANVKPGSAAGARRAARDEVDALIHCLNLEPIVERSRLHPLGAPMLLRPDAR